jgi:hypothetical protein
MVLAYPHLLYLLDDATQLYSADARVCGVEMRSRSRGAKSAQKRFSRWWRGGNLLSDRFHFLTSSGVKADLYQSHKYWYTIHFLAPQIAVQLPRPLRSETNNLWKPLYGCHPTRRWNINSLLWPIAIHRP